MIRVELADNFVMHGYQWIEHNKIFIPALSVHEDILEYVAERPDDRKLAIDDHGNYPNGYVDINSETDAFYFIAKFGVR